MTAYEILMIFFTNDLSLDRDFKINQEKSEPLVAPLQAALREGNHADLV